MQQSSALKSLKLEAQIDELDFALENQCIDPRNIVFPTLRSHIRATDVDDDPATNKARSRIKNRATAIRAYCYWCQGGFSPGIRECASITCPLWPFRLGKDPLRGYELPPLTIDCTDEDEEDVKALFGDGDDGDDTDAAED